MKIIQLNTWIHGMMRPFFTIRNMENIQMESGRKRPKESLKLLKSLLYQRRAMVHEK